MTTYFLKLFDINCLSLEKYYGPNHELIARFHNYVIVISLLSTIFLSDLTLNMSNTLGITRTDYPSRALDASFLVLFVVFCYVCCPQRCMCLQLSHCFQKLGWYCSLCPPVCLCVPYCVFHYDSGMKRYYLCYLCLF